jgi:hypothetical protein
MKTPPHLTEAERNQLRANLDDACKKGELFASGAYWHILRLLELERAMEGMCDPDICGLHRQECNVHWEPKAREAEAELKRLKGLLMVYGYCNDAQNAFNRGEVAELADGVEV